MDEAVGSEAAEKLFAQPSNFVTEVPKIDVLPPDSLPEVAFAGRSNVGKSSLVNALTGRRTLARASQTPGRTRGLIFFDLGGRLMLVDLPGYGYAKAPKGEIKRWTALTRAYLRGRQSLRRVALLIDARHGVKANDEAIMELLDEAAVSYQGVLTKTDKTKPPELAAVLAKTAERLAKHPAAHPEVLATSSESGQGLPELRQALAEFALPEVVSST